MFTLAKRRKIAERVGGVIVLPRFCFMWPLKKKKKSLNQWVAFRKDVFPPENKTESFLCPLLAMHWEECMHREPGYQTVSWWELAVSKCGPFESGHWSKINLTLNAG